MSLFNKSIKSKFITEIKKELGYFTTWLPGEPVKLGDVGVLINGSFERVTNLKNLGIDFDIDLDKSGSDFNFQSINAVKENMLVNGEIPKVPINCVANAKIGIGFTFSRAGAVVLKTNGAKYNSINDKNKLSRDIKQLGNEWQKNWVVITEVVDADSCTILIANSSKSESKFELEGNAGNEIIDIADASLKLKSLSIKNMLVNSVAEEGMTPLFKISKLETHPISGQESEVTQVKSMNKNFSKTNRTTLREITLEDLGPLE